jgi:hypothetical protein
LWRVVAKFQSRDIPLAIRGRCVPHDNGGGDHPVSRHQREVKLDLGAQRRAILGQAEGATDDMGAGEDLTLASEEPGTHDAPVLIT